MTPLRTSTLEEISARVPVPCYSRASVRTGFVHVGVGGFHRAHMAMCVDRLLSQGLADDWGICGVGLLPGDAAMRDALVPQDCLYSLVLKHGDGRREPRVIGSLGEYLFAPDDPDAVVEKMADPDVRIVSLTVTEGGYSIDNATGEFDPTTPDVAHDLAARGALPRSVFGLVVEALRRRRERGVAPFTIMSCDNVQGNGEVARRSFVGFASRLDPELGGWIGTDVAFPSSMVDRITPATRDEDRQALAADFGVDDAWPVVCEPFLQWVLEDDFPGGRPPFESAGVQLVQDVVPYELMKLRLLNAGHQALAYFGALMGYRSVPDVCAEPAIRRLLLDYMVEEAMPTLLPVPGIDLLDYCEELVERFSNPYVADTVARLCFDASERIPKFLLPVVVEQLRRGVVPRRAIAVVATWARYCEGADDDGRRIEVQDVRAERLTASALRQRQEPLAFLENRDVFGGLAEDSAFTSAYLEDLEVLHTQGARALLERVTA